MYNAKKIIKNAFRISKVRGEGAVRIRVPGGDLSARHLAAIKGLSERFGNGTVHLTTRQGFEIPGVQLSRIEEIKKFMGAMLYDIERDSHVILEKPEDGYPAIGARNVSACIGNRVCQFANCDAPRLAKKIEAVIYPQDYHLKIAVSACPNDCIKAHLQDIGVIAGVVPEYDIRACIACEACLDNCGANITNALRIEDYKIIRDEKYCLQCGECVLKCPMGAFSRGKKLYRIIVGGRTGKRNPRLANTFIKDASEEAVLEVCKSIFSFIDRYIDRSLPKEHLGYILDRAGFESFLEEVTNGINLNPEAKIVKLDNPGYLYPIRDKNRS